jgi:hypothetical protein
MKMILSAANANGKDPQKEVERLNIAKGLIQTAINKARMDTKKMGKMS